MESFDPLFLVIHVVCGSILAVVVVVMQTVFAPALANITAGNEKNSAMNVIKTRLHTTIDIVIILQIVTAMYLLHARSHLIGQNPILMVKAGFGILALGTAGYLHFYLRGKKMRTKQAGDMALFASLSARSFWLEKIVLVCAPTAYFIAVYFNHG